MPVGRRGWSIRRSGLTTGGRGGRSGEQTAPAQTPVPVPQPVAKADLTAMSPEELQAEKEKILEAVTADPRYAKFSKSNFTPEEKAEWDKDHIPRVYRFAEIEKEMEARAAQGEAVRA
jgi:hypothetical protein